MVMYYGGFILSLFLSLSLSAMESRQSSSISKRALHRLHDGAWSMVVGAHDDNNYGLIAGLNEVKAEQKNLNQVSFQELEIQSEALMRSLLKILVIQAEDTLFPAFLAMYKRSSPNYEKEINADLSLEANEFVQDPAYRYTLLDVATIAYQQSDTKAKAKRAQIIKTLAEAGAKSYGQVSGDKKG